MKTKVKLAMGLALASCLAGLFLALTPYKEGTGSLTL